MHRLMRGHAWRDNAMLFSIQRASVSRALTDSTQHEALMDDGTVLDIHSHANSETRRRLMAL